MKNTYPKSFLFSLVVLLLSYTSYSQQNISISQGGTVSVNDGDNFYDAGGVAGNDTNTSYTITLTPAVAGEMVALDFTYFKTMFSASQEDALFIYDGLTATGNDIGKLMGDYSVKTSNGTTPYGVGRGTTNGAGPDVFKPTIFSATNSSGALTLKFVNSSSSTYPGWIAKIITYKPSGLPGCNINLTANKTSICIGETVNLTSLGSIASSSLNNNFNGTIGTGWIGSPAATITNTVCSAPSLDNSQYLWMQNFAFPRTLESIAMDVSNGGTISFEYRQAKFNSDASPCESPDILMSGTTNEGIYVQYSIDGGTNWTTFKYIFSNSLNSNSGTADIYNNGCGEYVTRWTKMTYPIPTIASTTSTKFRWIQPAGTSASSDNWGLDNVIIATPKVATITIENRSTNAVLATTTLNSTVVSVSPITTTTYRATITDGTTTCFQDIIITVNSGAATTIGYPTSSTTLATTAPATVVTTITGSPATAGTYTATPAGLTISASNGQITPSTSTPGTYTVSAITACGTTTATVVILPQQCGSCATPTCIIGNGIDYFDSEINHQSNCNTILPVITGPSTYVSYHSVVVGTSGLLGVVASTIITVGCTSNRVFKLYPAASCGITATAISPWTTNANGSTFSNPEWTGLTPGNYILEISYTIASGCIMSNDCQSYYSPAATPITCQDYQIQMFDDDTLNTTHSGTTFLCTDQKVYLGPVNPPTNFDAGLPYQGLIITITALTGNTSNLVLNRYDPVTGLAEVLTFISPMENYFINAAPGEYYKLDKTNGASGTYSYVITDAITGAVLTSGTWTITGGVESGPSATVIPSGTSNYSGAGVSNGFDPAGLDNYTNNRGIGVFDPCIAGVGSHTITYSWNNGLTGANNCTITRTKNVTVTGSTSAPTATGSSICSGSTATITATATAGNVIKWYNAASGGTLLFTGNPFTTPALTATTSYWVTQTSTCCGESTRTQVTITITPGTAAAYTKAAVTCAPGSVTFSGISTGATFNWVSSPAGYTFATPTNSNLTNLPAGAYCVNITSPNTVGGTVNTTLLTEDFETNAPNWTIDNTGGNNQFIINNVYPGGTCTIGGVPFAVPAVPNEGAWATAGPTSKYLHIKATTTCGFSCAEPAFPPSNANYCSTTSYQKFTLNTPLNTIGKTNVTFSFYYINGVTDTTNDFGKLEYSINGGVTWIQSGTNLISHPTWFNQISTNAAWANQASLLFRITWNNNASSSTDPPLAVDQISIKADTTSLASCGTTVQECFTVNPVLTPTINCGTTTTSSVQFTWATVTGATGYSVSYQIGANPLVTIGAIGNVLNYTVTGLTSGASVTITVTPTGAAGTCFNLSTKICTAVACTPPTASISYPSVAYCKSFVGAQSINLSGTGTFSGGVYTSSPAGLSIIASGAITPSTSTASATPYTVTYTIAAIAGCSPVVATTTVVINATPSVPAVTTVQPTCTTATGSITITGVAGETYSFDGSPYAITLVYSGLLAGSTHTFYAKNAAGCISAVTSVTLNAQPATPSVPAVTTVQPTCTTATGSITIAGVAGETYSFDGGLYTGTLVYSGLLAGSTHTFYAKNAAGCISAVTSVTLNAQPATPSVPVVTTVQPTCTTATGSITITGVAGETYSFDGSPYAITLVYSGLLAGSTHTFYAKNAAGCISAVTSVTLNAQPATPSVPAVTTVQPTCTTATGSITIAGVAGETYSFDGSPYAITLVYSGLLASSTHTFYAKNAAGCISAVTSVTLNAQPATPSVPAVTTVQPTCTTATGSITITGVVGETYSFDGSPYAITLVYSGLLAGSTHTFYAKNAAGCISAVTSVTLNAQPATPSVPAVTTVQPTCTTATGSITITGVVGETYSFDGSPYAITLVYSGLLAGSTHTFYAKNAAGCISAVTSVTLNAQPATPSVPAVTTVQPTCTTATGSITITGVVGETYSFDGSPYAITLVYSGLLASSTHTFYAKNAAGCISAVTSVTLNAQPATPSVPAVTTVQPTCTTATGSITITGVVGETYSFDGSPYAITLVYSGLLAGSTHTFYAKNAAGCISAVTSVTLNAQPATPSVPAVTTVQPTCTTATGSITITGVAGETYSFDGGLYTGTLVYSGLLAGSTHTFYAKNAAGCISAVTSVTLNAQPATPSVPAVTTVQPTCTTATGSITITGVAGETYSFDGSPYAITLVYSGLLASSTHTFYAKNAAGCISAVTSVTLNAQPATPSVPAVTTVQPTCTTATGSITITGVVGETYSFDGSPYAITLVYSGLLAGSTHTFYAKNAAGCISAVTSVTLNAQPATPSVPAVTTVQPTCTTATGSITITGVVGETYSFDGSPYAITLVYSGLLAGSTHTFYAKNAAGCISAVTSVTLNAQPATPSVPAVTTVQPTCTTATGSITITGVAGETYSFDGGLYTGTLVYSGLLAGSTHTFYAKNAAGCISAVTSVTLNAQPATPSVPTFTLSAATCSANGTTTISNNVATNTYTFLPTGPSVGLGGIINNVILGTSYTVTSGNGSCTSLVSVTFTNLPQLVVPTIIATPTTETLCSLQSTGISLSSSIPTATFSWTISSTGATGATAGSGNAISQVLTATGTVVETVVYTATSFANGCFSTPINIPIIVTPKPTAIATPSLQSICSGNAPNIVLTGTTPGTTFTWNSVTTNVNGASSGTTAIISQPLTTIGDVIGEAVYSITPLLNGCPGLPILVTINVNPIPVISANPMNSIICSGETTAIDLTSSVPGTTYSWSVLQSGLFGTASGSGSQINQTLTTVGLVSGNVVYIITPMVNGCAGIPIRVTVLVNPTPELFGNPTQLPICSGEDTQIILTPNIIGTTFAWTATQNGVTGAIDGTGGSIIQTLETTGTTFGIASYDVTPTLNSCVGNTITISVRVNPLPTPSLLDGIICEDLAGNLLKPYLLNTGLGISNLEFEWYFNGVIIRGEVGNTLSAEESGIYSVQVKNLTTGCISLQTATSATVTPKNPGLSLVAEASIAFSDDASIIATVTGGSGDFEYSLDNGPFQTSNIFTPVESGSHIVVVRDINGCTNLTASALVIGYPTYFTPNGDSYHDYWNIIGFDLINNAKIYIFDRYGKLIKQINPLGQGWDGTYNETPMPSTDYWFTTDYYDAVENKNKVFKSHFSLKR